MSKQRKSGMKRIGILLTMTMVFAMVMGPGTPVTAHGGNHSEHSNSNDVSGIKIKVKAGSGGTINSPDWQVDAALWEDWTWDFTAVPDNGYRFDHWTFTGNEVSGAFSDNGADLSVKFTQSGDWIHGHMEGWTWVPGYWDYAIYKAQAVFAEVSQYTLSTSVPGGHGSIAKNPDKSTYDEGTTVTLTANPDSGYRFVEWSGDASGGGNPASVKMNGNKSVSARFEALPTYTLDVGVSPAGSGSVSKDPDISSYWEGRNVTLTANAAGGWRFGSWSVDASGSANPLILSMNGNKSITANFIKTFTVTLNTEGGGHLDRPGAVAGVRDIDSDINLDDAKPDANLLWMFFGWRDDETGQFLSSPAFVLTRNRSFTAVFTEKDRLTLNAGRHGHLANDLSGHYAQGTQINLNDAQPTGDTGYTLECWKESGDGWSEKYGIYNKDVKLVGGEPIITIGDSNYFKAFFKLRNYTVSFEENGGSTVADQSVTHGQKASRPAGDPARTGYDFAGWYADEALANAFDFDTAITGPTTIYAKWTPHTYTVVYHGNTGSGSMSPSTHTYNVAQNLTANAFTKEGCAFDGWARSPGGSQAYIDGQGVTNLTADDGAAIDLYARWLINNVIVDGYTGTYDRSPHGVKVSGTLSGDTVTYSTDGGVTYGSQPPAYTGATSGAGVTVHVKVERAGADDYNVTALIKIEKAPLTVKAANRSSQYGDPAPAYAVEYTGFLPGDNENNSLTGAPALSCAYAQGDPVGSYPIDVKEGSLSAANYMFSFAGGTLTVDKAVLTVTVNNKNITYGDAAPAYTAGYSGFKNGENSSVLSGAPLLRCSYAKGDGAGPYTIAATQGTLSAGNYDFSYINGTLYVSKVTLTVTADDKSVTYGDAAPRYTATYNGFIGRDDESVLNGTLVFHCAYTAGSPVSGSPYTITPSGLRSSKYYIIYVPGDLTVSAGGGSVTSVTTPSPAPSPTPGPTPEPTPAPTPEVIVDETPPAGGQTPGLEELGDGNVPAGGADVNSGGSIFASWWFWLIIAGGAVLLLLILLWIFGKRDKDKDKDKKQPRR